MRFSVGQDCLKKLQGLPMTPAQKSYRGLGQQQSCREIPTIHSLPCRFDSRCLFLSSLCRFTWKSSAGHSSHVDPLDFSFSMLLLLCSSPMSSDVVWKRSSPDARLTIRCAASGPSPLHIMFMNSWKSI